jgi:hypothetical protein
MKLISRGMDSAIPLSGTDAEMPLSILVCDRRVPALAGTRPTVATVLAELGHDVAMAEDGPVDLAPCDVILLYGNPGYFPKLRRQLLSTPKERRPLVAALHAEPLPPPRASGLPRWSGLNLAEVAKILLRDWRATDIYSNAFKLRRMMREGTIDLLFATYAEKYEYAREQGYECWLTPYGYHLSFGRLLGLDRDVDVLFLGEMRPRRRRRLLNQLRQAGIEVTVRGSWKNRHEGLWGEDRTRFLNRTKIIVHLQRYPGKLAPKRFFLAMANGAMVISEPAYRPEPFVDGEHYVSASIERMPDVIRHYLAHTDERERITAAAHRLVTEEITFARSMERMLDVIRSRLKKQEGAAGETATSR